MEIKRLIVGMVQTNCYIAVHPETKEAVIVDPGDEAARIEDALAQTGAKAKAILLTHGHFDHVTAMEELRRDLGVPVYACEQEQAVLADPDKNLSVQFQGGGLHLKADTLFEGSYGRIDFPTGSGRQMIHSVADILLNLPDDTNVYPGHMGYTTIADEKQYNPLAGYRGREA